MKLSELIKQITCEVTGRSTDPEITGVAHDSRQVRPGNLFVAVSGSLQDGVRFWEDAVGRGAVAVVAEQAISSSAGLSIVRVPDARAALAELACIFHGWPANRLRMIGITGTNGKTTTAYMLKDIVERAGHKTGLITTVEYRIGARTIPASRTTPDAATLQSMLAEMVNVGCTHAVMEVSSHALVQKRTLWIDYDVAVFTNLTRDHLDYHKTMDQYCDAKALLFQRLGMMDKKAFAVLNADDVWGRKLAALNGIEAERLTYGTGADAMIRAEEVQLSSQGSSFRAKTPWGDMEIQLPLLGRFNISNALAAVTAAGALGMAPDLIVEALRHIERVPGRLDAVSSGKSPQVFVDYAHTDDALERVLETLREITRGRLIVVFGCGGNRDRSKRAAMGAVAAQLADYSIITADNPRTENPRTIMDEILAGCGDTRAVEVVEDRRAAIQKALGMASPEDVVLVAGKGHENFQEFANRTIPFDDRQVVREILGLVK